MSVLAEKANAGGTLAAAPLHADDVQVNLVSLPVTCTPTAVVAGAALGVIAEEAADN